MFNLQLSQKISTDYIKSERIVELITLFIELMVIGGLLFSSYSFNWYSWVPIVLYVLLGLSVISFIFSYFFLPHLTVKNWSYEVDEEFVQLKFGRFFETYETIPMTKVQFVATHQGPIMKRYGLYSISIGTMGSNHKIPGLPQDIAFALKDTIAEFAKVKEVEQ